MFTDSSRAKFLIVDTESPTLRSEIVGWSYEDISLIDPTKPIGLSMGWNPHRPRPQFTCIAFALVAGWKLLGPPAPIETSTDDGPKTYWTWWLQNDEMSGDL